MRGDERQAHWAAVVTTALGIFVLVTSEMLPVGLLRSMAAELEVSVGVAGTTLTAPGLIAAVTAPVLTIAARRVDRRTLLVGAMALLALANAASALARTFPLLFAARVVVGVSVGAYWALAAGLGGRLVRGRVGSRATAIIFSGVAIASVLGVPAGALVGDRYGFRSAFALGAAVAAALAVALRWTMPALPGASSLSRAALRESLRNAGVRAGLVITGLLVVGHFAAYTFVSPVLQASAGIDEGTLGGLLLAYGCAGIAGNFAAGALASRDVRRLLQAVALALALSITSLPLLATGTAGALAVLIAWGLSYGAVGVTLQTWIETAAPGAIEPATALSVSTFNVSIATGAFLGGQVADHLGAPSVTRLGGVLALLAALAVQVARPRHAPVDPGG